jgi:hypothetical protein
MDERLFVDTTFFLVAIVSVRTALLGVGSPVDNVMVGHDVIFAGGDI